MIYDIYIYYYVHFIFIDLIPHVLSLGMTQRLKCHIGTLGAWLGLRHEARAAAKVKADPSPEDAPEVTVEVPQETRAEKTEHWKGLEGLDVFFS